MARGFLMGAISGAVIGVGLGTLASVIAPAPKLSRVPVIADTAPTPVVTPPTAPAGTGMTGPEEAELDTAPDIGQTAALAEMPDTDTLTSLDTAAVQPARAPQTGGAEGAAAPSRLPVPPTAPETSDIATAGEDPVLPNPQALAPMLPQAADTVSVDTTPAVPLVTPDEPAAEAQTPEPQAVAEEDAAPESNTAGNTQSADAADAPDEGGTVEMDQTADLSRPVQPAPQPDVAPASQPDDVAQVSPEPVPTPAPAPQPDDVAQVSPEPVLTPAPAPQPDDVAQASPEPVPAPAPAAQPETIDAAPDTAEQAPRTEISEAPQPVPAPAPEVPASTEVAQAPVATIVTPSARPQIGTPAISLTERNAGVRINRLGTQQTQQQATTTEVTVITEEGTPEAGSDPRPVARFGQTFSNPEDKPLMSIVLIDDGTGSIGADSGIAKLSDFPYALSFAVDSSLPDAVDRVAAYRADGFDVLSMIDLPNGARPSDVETTLGVTLTQMNDVVGVLEGPGTGLQGARDVADQVTAILAQTGHGLVTQDKGLNTMPKLARKAGVPADPIFRDFDSKGQSAQVIRRFLDQAAFKAGQEGAVIMLGRVRPETISALLLWGLQDRAGQVALAPISATLLREVE